MIKLITIQKDGKITIPKEIRKEIGLTGQEQYVLVADEGNIIFKRVGRSFARKRMKELMDEFSSSFRKEKISKNDIVKAVKDIRLSK